MLCTVQTGFSLLSAILQSGFSLDERWAQANLPLLTRLLKEDRAPEGREKREKEEPQVMVATRQSAGHPFRVSLYSNLDQVPEGSTAVISLKGPIMKYYSYCGASSIETARLIREAAAHKNISAILLDIDSPGGQVSGLATVVDAIRAARGTKPASRRQKAAAGVKPAGIPVVALVNDGMICSAAYYIASACSEIHAGQKSDEIGSIGAMQTIYDYSKQLEQEGVKVISLYAPQSHEKNLPYRQALAGKPELMIEELRQCCADFIDLVKAERGAKLNLKAGDPFAGAVFRADQALAIGLIDEISSYDDALARCVELVQVGETTPFSPDTISPDATTMKYPKIRTAAGISTAFESTKDGVHLQEPHLEAIEAKIEAGDKAAADLTASNEAKAAADKQLADATTAHKQTLTEKDALIASQAGQLAAKELEIARLGKVPGEKPAAPVRAGADRSEPSEDEDFAAKLAALPHNQAYDRAAQG